MPTTVPSVDFSSRDQESLFLTLRSQIEFFLPEWTFHGESDFGIGLLHLFSYLGDILHFYIDRAVEESHLPTALSRDNVVRILKLIDYELRGRASATVEVTFSISAALTFDVSIPAGTVVQATGSDGDPVVFRTTAAATIAAGMLSATVEAVEGQQLTSQALAISDGSANQRYVVPLDRTVPSTLRVFVDEGGGPVEWSPQDSLFLSTPTDTHYTVQRDGDETITVFFGDGVRGKVPTATSPVTFDIVVGGGLRGNVPAGAVSTVVSTVTAGTPPVAVSLLVTNAEAAAGGDDPEGIEEAKELGPKSIRALERAVTSEDVEQFAEGVEGVLAARVRIPEPVTRRAQVVIVPVGGGPPSQVLKDAVLDALAGRTMLGTIVEAVAPTYIDLDIKGTVQVLPNFRRTVVRDAVQAALASFFTLNDPGTSDFGTDLRIGNVYQLVEGVSGVDYINFSRFTIKPSVKFPIFTPSSAALTSVGISPTTIPEVWTIRVTSPSTFLVEGSVSGPQPAAGTVGVPYETAGRELSFLLSYPASSLNLLSPGDTIEVRVSTLIGDVLAEDDEFMFSPDDGQTIFTYSGGA